MKKCPYCAKKIKEEAIKCKYCGEFLADNQLPESDLKLDNKENDFADIGDDISWANIVRHVFRVFNFDKNGTIVGPNDQVIALSSFEPYGYLHVDSPIFNYKLRLPIIHRDDFLLAASVFDDPNLDHFIIDEELLVTYAPKKVLPNGFSASSRHVLHYAITCNSHYLN